MKTLRSDHQVAVVFLGNITTQTVPNYRRTTSRTKGRKKKKKKKKEQRGVQELMLLFLIFLWFLRRNQFVWHQSIGSISVCFFLHFVLLFLNSQLHACCLFDLRVVLFDFLVCFVWFSCFRCAKKPEYINKCQFLYFRFLYLYVKLISLSKSKNSYIEVLLQIIKSMVFLNSPLHTDLFRLARQFIS